MNPSKSPEQVLKNLFPILLVLIVLIVGVVVMPTLSADPRSRASEPRKVIVTPKPILQKVTTPEVVCSDLYSPVCDTATNTTYPNDCEANLAKATKITKGECPKPSQISLPTSN